MVYLNVLCSIVQYFTNNEPYEIFKTFDFIINFPQYVMCACLLKYTSSTYFYVLYIEVRMTQPLSFVV